MNLQNRSALCLLLILLLTPAAWALESDRLQPLKIVADRAVLSDKDGTATYTGNVVLTQGTLSIKAGRLHIQTEQGKVSLVTAEGNPAEFSQVPVAGQAPVVATALTIHYEVKTQKLTLRRKASIVQSENIFKGEEIVYEIQSQRLKAVGQTKETPQGEAGTGRVEMILPSAAELAPQPKPADTPAPQSPASTPVQPTEEPVKTAP
jgi:lipopolysaccharide export system protein LptA